MRVEILDGVNYTFTSFQFLTIENPYLNSTLNICVILKMIHLSDRFKTNPVETTLNYHGRRGGY